MSEDIAIGRMSARLSSPVKMFIRFKRRYTSTKWLRYKWLLWVFSLHGCYVEFCRSMLLWFFIRYPQSVVEHHIHNVCCYFYCDCYWIYYIFQFHVNFIGTMHHYMHIFCKWWRKWNWIYPKWWRKFNLKSWTYMYPFV